MRYFLSKSVLRSVAISAGLYIGSTAPGLAQVPALPDYATLRQGKTNPESFSSDEVLWAVFQSVSLTEDASPGSGEKLLEASGMSREDSLALFKHIRASVDDTKAYGADLLDRTCANKTSLAASASLLAQTLKSIDSSVASRRAARIAEIDMVVSRTGKDALLSWADKSIRPHMSSVSFDHEKYLTARVVDPATAASLLCSKSTSTDRAVSTLAVSR